MIKRWTERASLFKRVGKQTWRGKPKRVGRIDEHKVCRSALYDVVLFKGQKKLFGLNICQPPSVRFERGFNFFERFSNQFSAWGVHSRAALKNFGERVPLKERKHKIPARRLAGRDPFGIGVVDDWRDPPTVDRSDRAFAFDERDAVLRTAEFFPKRL